IMDIYGGPAVATTRETSPLSPPWAAPFVAESVSTAMAGPSRFSRRHGTVRWALVGRRAMPAILAPRHRPRSGIVVVGNPQRLGRVGAAHARRQSRTQPHGLGPRSDEPDPGDRDHRRYRGPRVADRPVDASRREDREAALHPRDA